MTKALKVEVTPEEKLKWHSVSFPMAEARGFPGATAVKLAST